MINFDMFTIHQLISMIPAFNKALESKKMDDINNTATSMRYHVSAGKLEFYKGKLEKNYKYCDSFYTFEDAYREYLKSLSYDFAEIEFVNDKGELIPIMFK